MHESRRSSHDEWRSTRRWKSKGEPPIAPAWRISRVRPTYNMRRFSGSAIKASKKTAITRSTRLQRHDLRFCAISLLIVSTRSNQNAHAVVRWRDGILTMLPCLSWLRFQKKMGSFDRHQLPKHRRIRRNLNSSLMLCYAHVITRIGFVRRIHAVAPGGRGAAAQTRFHRVFEPVASACKISPFGAPALETMFRTLQVSRSGWDKMGRNGTLDPKKSHFARCLDPAPMAGPNALTPYGNAAAPNRITPRVPLRDPSAQRVTTPAPMVQTRPTPDPAQTRWHFHRHPA